MLHDLGQPPEEMKELILGFCRFLPSMSNAALKIVGRSANAKVR